jgi:hypothetical protein
MDTRPVSFPHWKEALAQAALHPPLKARSPDAASGEEVAAFLSALAVQGRASPSTQKQALNALVFLMQEALHRDLGQMEFRVYGFADAV